MLFGINFFRARSKITIGMAPVIFRKTAKKICLRFLTNERSKHVRYLLVKDTSVSSSSVCCTCSSEVMLFKSLRAP